MIDSHCHLDCIDVSEREGGVQSVLDLAREHGVDRMLCISITLGNDGPRQLAKACLLYTSPSPRDQRGSRMPSSA